MLFANKNVIVNSRIKLSGYGKQDNTDNEGNPKVEGNVNAGRESSRQWLAAAYAFGDPFLGHDSARTHSGALYQTMLREKPED